MARSIPARNIGPRPIAKNVVSNIDMNLFDDKTRTDSSPAKHLDNTYRFYDRSASIFAEQIRELLNSWFNHYPDVEKLDLKRRFETSFSASFYELFLHELFRRQGFTLTPHPSIDGTKKPDFLAVGNGTEFYIEAKEATDMSDAERSQENRINQLYDTLTNCDSPNFFFDIQELTIKTTNPFKGKLISEFIKSKLPNFDPETVANRVSERGLRPNHDIVYEDGDIKLVISLIAKSKESRGKPGIRPIGIYPFISTWGGSSVSIKTAIQRKAARYGQLNKPYLVCINSTGDRVTDEHEIMEALLGTLKVHISSGPNGLTETWTRDSNGIFLDNYGPKFTRVSAVLVTEVYPTTVHIANHWLVNNPFATQILDFNQLNLSCYLVEGGQITFSKKSSIAEIMQLHQNWLNLET